MSCFICLEDTKNKVCCVCNLHAHISCWNMYCIDKQQLSTSISMTGTLRQGINCKITYNRDEIIECPVCKISIPYSRVVTRAQRKEKEDEAYRKLVFFLIDLYYIIDMDEWKKNKRDEILQFAYVSRKRLRTILSLDEELVQAYRNGKQIAGNVYEMIYEKEMFE